MNKKMKIALVIIAIILTVVVFCALNRSMSISVEIGMNDGIGVLFYIVVLVIATLCFAAILIVSVFKCSSMVSLGVIWGITILLYSIHPISAAIDIKQRQAKAALEEEFYRVVKDKSTSWEEFRLIVKQIEYDLNVKRYRFFEKLTADNGIFFQLLYNKRFDFADKAIEEGFNIRDYNMTEYLSRAYQSREQQDTTRLDQIEFLFSKGCDINAVSSEEMKGNSLNTTLLYEDNRSAQFLLDKGIDLNIPGSISPIAVAAWKNNIVMVKQLLAKGVDINILGTTKVGTPLTFCASGANKEVVELLLKSGATVNAVDNIGETALMKALDYNKDIAVAEALIRSGADVDILDKYGHDAIYNITQCGSYAEDRIKLLVKSGAILTRTYPNGKTLHEIATEKGVVHCLSE